MSFGTSTTSRFQLDTNPKGKPGIFFLGKENKQKPVRKFGYKERSLRHPIRNPDSRTDVNDEEKIPVVDKKPIKPDKNFIKKNRERLAGKSVHSDKNGRLNGGTVTLTQEQLTAILESVGNLREGKENALRISIDTKNNEIKLASPRNEIDDNPQSTRSEKPVKQSNNNDSHDGNILDILLDKGEIEEDRKSDNTDVINFKNEISARKEKEKQSEKNENNNQKKDMSSPRRKEKHSSNKDDKTEERSEEKKEVIEIPSVPPTHLTVAERKRLQWARERDETENYDPWGKPGAGAPPMKHITEYAKMEENKRKSTENLHKIAEAIKTSPQLSRKRNTSPTYNTVQTSQQYGTLNIGQLSISNKEEDQRKLREELAKQLEEKRLQKRREREQNQLDDTFANQLSEGHKPAPLPPQLATFVYSSNQNTPRDEYEPQVPKQSPRWVQDQKIPPAAMRSSFAFGGLALDDTKYKQTKEEERRKWMEEIEKQKEEKRMKDLGEKEKQRIQDERDDRMWASPRPAISKISPRHQAHVEVNQRHGVSSTSPHLQHNLSNTLNTSSHNIGGRSNSAPDDSAPTLIRGQNVIIDPVTLKDLELKRQRHIEHQEAIKNQIDEKKNNFRKERERKWAEEQEEERRLQKERETIQNQFLLDQQRLREKEKVREKKLEQLKAAMDEAQERALHEKHLKRMQHLQQGGHDISQLKANYDAMTPRVHQLDQSSTNMPQLNQSAREMAVGTSLLSYRSDNQPQQDLNTQSNSQELVHHDDYINDRVLTPLRYRHLSEPHTDPYSTKRHFGTQTYTLTDENGLKREVSDVKIEYKLATKQKSRKPLQLNVDKDDTSLIGTTKLKKVRLKSAAQVKKFKPEKPKKPKEKLGWNYNNQKVKKALKNSEKDPFYEEKKQASQARHAKRAARLYKMMEANKQIIPDGSRSPSPRRNKSLSPYRGSSPRHDKSLSPAIRSDTRLLNTSDPSPRRVRSMSPLTTSRTHNSDDHKSLASVERRSRLDHYKHRPHEHSRYKSPPVPAVKHRRPPHDEDDDNHSKYDPENYGRHRSHYADMEPITPPVNDNEFIPFTRTTEILDPSHAEDPLTVSRENTRVTKGRKAYRENQQPADFGNRIDIYEDKSRNEKDPIFNPGLVKNHPTGRQGQILQQLTTLKQSLMQRQRELETCMSPSDFTYQ